MQAKQGADSTRQQGFDAETLACRHLESRGLTLLQRNYSCRYGELDLIMREGKTIVFVEVRMRSNRDFGDGAASITATKQRRLTAAAHHYLQRNGGIYKHPARIDVISIDGLSRAVDWIQNAIQAE